MYFHKKGSKKLEEVIVVTQHKIIIIPYDPKYAEQTVIKCGGIVRKEQLGRKKVIA